MRKELEQIERIEQYLMNKLNATEKLNFETQMAGDANLTSQVNFQRDFMAAVKRVGLKNTATKARKKYRFKKVLKQIGLGALIAGGLAAGTYFFLSDSEGIVDNKVEVEQFIVLPENDSLSATANAYLDQEVFQIDVNKDTVIETKDGIVVSIPANAFDSESGQVDVLMQGAVQPYDVLKAGLSTTTDDGVALETGGMFYIDAFEQDKRVDLVKDLTVDVPASNKLPGMQVYDGVKDENGEIVWTAPKPVETFLTPVDILSLDFYPPGYEAALSNWGYYGKAFRDSLYYSFAFKSDNCSPCEEYLKYNVPMRKITPEERDFIYGDNRPIDALMTLDEAVFLCENGMLSMFPDPALGKELFNGNCASCHFPNKDMTGPALKGARERWIENSSEENFYAYIKNSQAVIASGDAYANQLFEHWNNTVMTPQALTNEQIDHIFAYVDRPLPPLREVVREAQPVFDSIDSVLYPELIEEAAAAQDDLLDEIADTTWVSDANAAATEVIDVELGVDPAAVQSIWNAAFNKTNLATKEFEERMPWIHKTCDTEVLNVYILHLNEPLYVSDSIAFLMTSGGEKWAFRDFYERKDGRVQEISEGGIALYNYYEKKRKANAEAARLTQENYWKDQEGKDNKNAEETTKSETRSTANESEVFLKEYQKNRDKVIEDLGLNKSAPSGNSSSYTVTVSSLGWKNVDREILELTVDRTSGDIEFEGKTSSIKYEDWSATISGFEQYDRVNVYNIPKEFNSYVKLKGEGNKFKHELNADLKYQTLVLAWTEQSIFFFQDKRTKPGNHTLALKAITNDEFRNNVAASLSTVSNMEKEMNYIEYAQKDQARINSNIRKELLKAKAEKVIFPCRFNDSGWGFTTSSEGTDSGHSHGDGHGGSHGNTFEFDSTPLKEVVRKLNNAFDKKTVLDETVDDQLLLTAHFENESHEMIIDALCVTLKLEARESGNQIVLTSDSNTH